MNTVEGGILSENHLTMNTLVPVKSKQYISTLAVMNVKGRQADCWGQITL